MHVVDHGTRRMTTVDVLHTTSVHGIFLSFRGRGRQFFPGKDAGFVMCPDRINDLLCAPIVPQVRLASILAFQDKHIRVYAGEQLVGEHQLYVVRCDKHVMCGNGTPGQGCTSGEGGQRAMRCQRAMRWGVSTSCGAIELGEEGAT